MVRKAVSNFEIKTLRPKDPDLKYFGEEPDFVKDPMGNISKAFTWYHRFYSKKDGKEFMYNYLVNVGKVNESRIIMRVPDSDFIQTFCWLARMMLRGLVLSPDQKQRFDDEVSRLMTLVKKEEPVEAEKAPKVNIQEIMKEKAHEAAGELEGLFDQFIAEGCKPNHGLRPIDEVAKKNVLPQHVPIIKESWSAKFEEFSMVLESKDSDIIQGYSNFSKPQLKNVIKFIEQVLNDLDSYISVKKVSKAPRARKAVPVEKVVSKLKYLKTFTDEQTKLELVSISPVKLHGASEAWVYDTAKRKLHHYVADEYSKTFTVKGNTLMGFSTKDSEVKTLRKPKEQLKEIMGSKPAARKYFKDIKSVPVTPNGRFNDSMIILKAF
jgi:hypothetical protein